MPRPAGKRCGSLHTFFFVPLVVCAALLPGCAAFGGRLPPPLAEGSLEPEEERAARAFYERGVQEAGERRWPEAHAAFDSVVTRYPTSRWSTIALRERGLAAYRQGSHAEAAADLRRVLRVAPGYETTDTVIVLASALQRQGEPREALRELAHGLPEGDDADSGARAVAAAAVNGLQPGQAERLVDELAGRPFLAPLYARAAREVRSRDPQRAAALARTAAELGDSGTPGEVATATATTPRTGSGTTVGAIFPSAGRLAGVARDLEDGVRLALEEVAASGGPTYGLEVLPEDGALPPAAAIDRLAEAGARVVIGPVESADAVAAARAALERDLLLVSPTATDTALLHMGPNVVTLNASAGLLGHTLGEYAARRLGLLRVATLAGDDEDSRADAEAFRKAFEAAGGEIVLEESFPRGHTSFGAALRASRLRGAEALFLPTRSDAHVLTVISQMSYYSGGGFRLLGTAVMRDDGFLRRAGSFAEGATFADTFAPDARVTRYWDFRSAYYKRYGRSPTTNFPAWGYDAAMLALRYLTGSSADEVATYRGAAATYRVSEGSVRKVPVVSRIEAGAPVLEWIDDAG